MKKLFTVFYLLFSLFTIAANAQHIDDKALEQLISKPQSKTPPPKPAQATKAKARTERKVTHIYPAKKNTVVDVDSMKIRKNTADTNLCFPMSKDKLYNLYDYVIFLDDSTVYKRYKPFFDKYQYKFSGYVWEAIIKQMLEETDKDIFDNMVMRSQPNAVMIDITRYQNLRKFSEYLCPIFSNLVRFESYLKNADRKRVPNY